MGIVIIAFIVVFIISKFVRMFFFNLHNIGIYTIVDFFRYVRDKEWTRFNNYGIDMFVGMFGHGKTLSMVHKARQLYKRYGNNRAHTLHKGTKDHKISHKANIKNIRII